MCEQAAVAVAEAERFRRRRRRRLKNSHPPHFACITAAPPSITIQLRKVQPRRTPTNARPSLPMVPSECSRRRREGG
jgi:hypothetical protein